MHAGRAFPSHNTRYVIPIYAKTRGRSYADDQQLFVCKTLKNSSKNKIKLSHDVTHLPSVTTVFELKLFVVQVHIFNLAVCVLSHGQLQQLSVRLGDVSLGQLPVHLICNEIRESMLNTR